MLYNVSFCDQIERDSQGPNKQNLHVDQVPYWLLVKKSVIDSNKNITNTL